MGVPFDTRFAHAMVDADYLMKRVADGSVALGVPGFKSHTELRASVLKERIANGRPLAGLAGLQMDRFWFASGKTTFVEDDDAIILDRCPVVLLTERDFLRSAGRVSGSGAPDPLSKRFADGFTNRYDEIAGRQAAYADLRALFRFVALTRVMASKHAEGRAGLRLGYLRGRYTVGRVSVKRELPGIAAVRRMAVSTAPSSATVTYWSLTCGGVSMDVSVGSGSVLRDSSGALERLARSVVADRPGAGALYWDVTGLPR
jgi:hypothetical protein